MWVRNKNTFAKIYLGQWCVYVAAAASSGVCRVCRWVSVRVCVCASKHPSLCVRTSNHVYVYNIHVLYTLYTMPYHAILYFSIVHSMWPCTSCLSRSCTWNKSTTIKWARKSKPSQFIHTHTHARTLNDKWYNLKYKIVERVKLKELKRYTISVWKETLAHLRNIRL